MSDLFISKISSTKRETSGSALLEFARWNLNAREIKLPSSPKL
jgi:hypothetical protein